MFISDDDTESDTIVSKAAPDNYAVRPLSKTTQKLLSTVLGLDQDVIDNLSANDQVYQLQQLVLRLHTELQHYWNVATASPETHWLNRASKSELTAYVDRLFDTYTSHMTSVSDLITQFSRANLLSMTPCVRKAYCEMLMRYCYFCKIDPPTLWVGVVKTGGSL
jgi:hypothetical protein